ncbi:sensor histidine kinase [Caldicellulosiruptor changbaiensis]|uniref:histidine kinase n=1 Tax=Caldicellulosiruptor changbaiensis TaxID=1222016 RepID=A0A3T0D835_9FIRM|nr:LytS/YhcK type 5TM receptor domain-containing protein [Caldicellulosiruptor changbaiensis]AZT91331.1 sensor histidine kinase [Caldicellulosiruptor changbaiensis]
MQEVFFNLAERLCVIVTLAFFLSKTKLFSHILDKQLNIIQKIGLIIGGGLFGILGTYWGIPIKGAIANSRVIGPAIVGIIGGPYIGLLAGFIAGLHRTLLGGFTAVACGISTTVEGLIAGLVAKKFSDKKFKWYFGILTGMSVEILQMIIILGLARPFKDALDLIKIIGIPMIIINGIGIGTFLLILENVVEEKKKIGTIFAAKALYIANETLPILRGGLTKETAQKVAEIVLNETDADAVAITDKSSILSYTGWGENEDIVKKAIEEQEVLHKLKKGEICSIFEKEDNKNNGKTSRLISAIICPLFVKNNMIGTLQLLYNRFIQVNDFTTTFVKGLSQLISTQLEIAELEKQTKLLAKAELKALQAQINPHFLFNSLNSIVALCRIDPEKARELIIKLSEYFRRHLREWEPLIPLSEEIENINLYLTFEKARFSDKLQIEFDIQCDTTFVKVPPFSVETLVENAIKHGLLPKKGGLLQIRATKDGHRVVIEVVDNGVGMNGNSSNGVGLSNLKERLKNFFGDEGKLIIVPNEGGGTIARLIIPVTN